MRVTCDQQVTRTSDKRVSQKAPNGITVPSASGAEVPAPDPFSRPELLKHGCYSPADPSDHIRNPLPGNLDGDVDLFIGRSIAIRCTVWWSEET